ncbi:MAG: hypothetical protein B7Y59_06445 [Burkholderiales bacterium 35-55-47]|nr:MAG: hypothetical protein B7Y59_06445 [Burkholderiales bacterium 35-55-47]OYZ73799.1 MAG: hypothetical protein B7Y06_05875 [Burkholderiales bacterium 24-55-52]OZB00943.1 MAG: hypothetical protein B7X62_05890 [Burkholderiales bacterium 39-55-53]
MVQAAVKSKTAAAPAAKKPAAKAPAKKVTATKRPAAKKPVVKKAAVKPSVTKTAVKKAPAKPVKTVKPAKVKKPKLVRDSFTIPKDEYVVIDSLKIRAGKLGQAVKKSELLRAGVKALAAMSDIQFKAALSNVPTIKTGRPKGSK